MSIQITITEAKRQCYGFKKGHRLFFIFAIMTQVKKFKRAKNKNLKILHNHSTQYYSSLTQNKI